MPVTILRFTIWCYQYSQEIIDASMDHLRLDSLANEVKRWYTCHNNTEWNGSSTHILTIAIIATRRKIIAKKVMLIAARILAFSRIKFLSKVKVCLFFNLHCKSNILIKVVHPAFVGDRQLIHFIQYLEWNTVLNLTPYGMLLSPECCWFFVRIDEEIWTPKS